MWDLSSLSRKICLAKTMILEDREDLSTEDIESKSSEDK